MEKSELHCNLALLIKEFSQLSSISININYEAWVKVCLTFLLYVMIKICTCVTIITIGGDVYTLLIWRCDILYIGWIQPTSTRSYEQVDITVLDLNTSTISTYLARWYCYFSYKHIHIEILSSSRDQSIYKKYRSMTEIIALILKAANQRDDILQICCVYNFKAVVWLPTVFARRRFARV